MFTKCLQDEANKHVLVVQNLVRVLLVKNFGFSELYAAWLPKNLQYLTRGSIKILEGLEDADYRYMFYSTVVSINDEKEMNTFKANIKILDARSTAQKRNILDSGV